MPAEVTQCGELGELGELFDESSSDQLEEISLDKSYICSIYL